MSELECTRAKAVQRGEPRSFAPMLSPLLVLVCGASTSLGEAAVVARADWPLIGGNDLEQHYSPVAQIDAGNVKGLKLAWYADMPTVDGLTGIPIVVDGVVYQSGALGKAWAHDVRTGRLLWEFDAGLKFPMDIIPAWGARLSRGLAVWGDKVLKASGDCRLFALDRRTGHKVWEAKSCDPAEYKTITGAPRVGDGKVFIGNASADTGIGRGWVDAYDVETGKHLWRFYTIPGDPALGFENAAMEMASKTWGQEYWKRSGGGCAWDGITYDPRTDLVYIGTDSPSPVSPVQRGKDAGDELFTNAVVAVKADTGEYVWHYSTTPGDGWNFSAAMPFVLADLEIAGSKRSVVMSAPKNGFFYVLDARTGKLVNEPRNIVPVNWASRIDMATGRPVPMKDAQYWLQPDGRAVVIPGPMGAHNWMPMSYSPKTGLVYIPAQDTPTALRAQPGSLVGALDADPYYSLKRNERFQGLLVAWDPVLQRERWSRKIGMPYQGGTLVTGGNVVFQGSSEGEFSAYNAGTGEKLWSYPVDAGILAAPATVMVDGNQLVLIPIGSGSTSAVSFAPKLATRTDGDARLLAFSLKGNAVLPPSKRVLQPFDRPVAARPDPTLALAGKTVFEANGCELCHGYGVDGGIGSVPDLRRINQARWELFSQIVRRGLFKYSGMPEFGDSISEEQVPALQAYILEEAWSAYDRQQAARGNKEHR